MLPGGARRARLRDQRLRHDGRTGTGRIAGRPLRRGGEQLRNGPQGPPGADGCARGVGDRTLRTEGLRRGGGTPRPGGEPGSEASGCSTLPRAELSRARRRSGRRRAPSRIPWSDSRHSSDQTSRRRAPADAQGAPPVAAVAPLHRHESGVRHEVRAGASGRSVGQRAAAVLWLQRPVLLGLEVMVLSIRPAFALALLFVAAFTVSTASAFAREKGGSLALEYKRRAPAVLPPASEVEKDAAQAAEEIEARKQTDRRIRENEGDPSRRPDLDPDV